MISTNKEIPEFSIRYLNITSLAGIIIFSLTIVVYYYFAILTITRNSLIVFDRDLQYTKGSVVSITESSFAEGGEMSHYPIFKIAFRYQVGDATYTNIGYTTSKDIRQGDELNVSYKESNPKISKAATLKASPFGLFVLLGIVLPVAGLLLFLQGLRWGNNFVLMLKNGAIAYGQLLSVVRNGEDYKHYYLYEDGDGRKRRVAFKTSDKKVDERVRILYDQHDPDKAEVLNWNNLPILFGRNTIRRMLNGGK